MAGRRYEEDEALEFWLEGHAESAEVTEKLQKTWDKFGTAVDKSLEKHLTDDEYMAVTGSEGEEAIKSDVYATLAGHGIGIWDGRWDGYMSQARLKTLQPKLKRDLGKWVDVTGGGKLEDAFHEAVSETGYGENPQISVRRKGYTTKRGTHVKPARFKIEDKGRPGVRSFGAKSATGKYAHRRTMKPLITGGTTLGGPGYTKKAEATRHRLLNECVKKFGYRSCLSKLQAVLISTAIKPVTRKVWTADKKWLMKKYGGPGSFGPHKGKKTGRKVAKRGSKKNPVSVRQIMRDAMK